jgi:hypothetical protein
VTKLLPKSSARGVAPPAGSMPPAPPSGISDGSGSGGCGFIGLEWLLIALARAVFPRGRRNRKLVA